MLREHSPTKGFGHKVRMPKGSPTRSRGPVLVRFFVLVDNSYCVACPKILEICCQPKVFFYSFAIYEYEYLLNMNLLACIGFVNCALELWPICLEQFEYDHILTLNFVPLNSEL